MISVTQNKVNLCSSCKHGYPSCPAKVTDVLFGDGTGYDNICCCAYYKPKCDTEEAYQRGLSEGNDIGYKDGVNDGRNEAWECARKLFSSMADSDIEKAFPVEWNNGGFNALINLQPQEAIAKLKVYEEKQDDKPIIGEVVERYLNGKRDGVGMFLGEDGDYWNCLFWTGAIFGTFAYPSNQFKRTGNVCDITKILEATKA